MFNNLSYLNFGNWNDFSCHKFICFSYLGNDSIPYNFGKLSSWLVELKSANNIYLIINFKLVTVKFVSPLWKYFSVFLGKLYVQ